MYLKNYLTHATTALQHVIVKFGRPKLPLLLEFYQNYYSIA